MTKDGPRPVTPADDLSAVSPPPITELPKQWAQTPPDKIEIIRSMYEQGLLTADDLRRVVNDDSAARAQKFFADIGAETRKASFGEMARGWTQNLLIRAEEAGLYVPPGKQ